MSEVGRKSALQPFPQNVPSGNLNFKAQICMMLENCDFPACNLNSNSVAWGTGGGVKAMGERRVFLPHESPQEKSVSHTHTPTPSGPARKEMDMIQMFCLVSLLDLTAAQGKTSIRETAQGEGKLSLACFKECLSSHTKAAD